MKYCQILFLTSFLDVGEAEGAGLDDEGTGEEEEEEGAVA